MLSHSLTVPVKAQAPGMELATQPMSAQANVRLK